MRRFIFAASWGRLFLLSCILSACGVNASFHSWTGNLKDPIIPGQMPSWGIDGMLKVNVTEHANLTPTALVHQPNGSILVTHLLSTQDPHVVRYLANGQVDTGFGVSGVLKISLERQERESFPKMVASDTHIYFLFSGNNFSSPGFYVKKFSLSTGDLDSSFGQSGVASPLPGLFYAWFFERLPDGKLIVGGHSNVANYKVTFLRLNADGSKDTSYGASGEFVYDSPSSDHVRAAFLTSTNKIVAAVRSTPGSTLSVFRINEDGTLDSSGFASGAGGILSTTISSNYDFTIGGIGELSDGSLILTGGRQPCNGCHSLAMAIKVTSAGALDTGFDGDGYFYRTIPGISGSVFYGGAYEVSAGVLLLLGHAGQLSSFATQINSSTGAVDTGFANAGHQIGVVSPPANAEFISAQKYQNDVWLLGTRPSSTVPSYQLSMLVKVRPDLQLETSFGSAGVAETLGGPGKTDIYRMASSSQGKTLVAGWSETAFYYSYLSRLLPDGSLDAGFGDNGTVLNIFGENPLSVGEIWSIRELSTGQIVVAGEVSDSTHRYFATARINSDGSHDLTYGTSGVALLETTSLPEPDITAASIDGFGAAVAATYPSAGAFSVLKINASGQADSLFDGDGIKNGVADPNSSWPYPMYVAPHPDGSWVISGYAEADGGPWEIWTFFFKIKADGTLDTSFDGDGHAVYDNNEVSSDCTPYGLSISNSGTIYSIGLAYYSPDFDYESDLIALDSSGSLLSTFGAGGVVRTGSDFFTDEWGVNALHLWNNRIYALGMSPTQDFILAAWTEAGTPVYEVGTNGRLDVIPGTRDLQHQHRGWFWDAFTGTAKILYDAYKDNGIFRVQSDGQIE